MPHRFRVLVAAALLLPSAAAPAQEARPRQAVIISFDSANDIAQWQRSRALAARTGAHFTYFLSCVFLLSPDVKGAYKAPGKPAGRSNIGFARSKQDVAARLDQIAQAAGEGHEIASHGCGHFDGGKWTKAEWLSELRAFAHVLGDAYAINGISPEPAGWRHVAQSVTGFRAPYLSTGKALYEALAEAGYTFDASGVSRGPAEPDLSRPVARFALPQIPEGPGERRVIAMDYNLFVRHTGGFERKDEEAVFENRAYRAFREAFDRQHGGGRIPLEIGFHFTLMNDGAYWRALERFAGEVCTMQDVDCITYSDYIARRKAQPLAAPVSGTGG